MYSQQQLLCATFHIQLGWHTICGWSVKIGPMKSLILQGRFVTNNGLGVLKWYSTIICSCKTNSYFYFQIFFLFIQRVLVGAGSCMNPFIYATTIPQFKEGIHNLGAMRRRVSTRVSTFGKSVTTDTRTWPTKNIFEHSQTGDIELNKRVSAVP